MNKIIRGIHGSLIVLSHGDNLPVFVSCGGMPIWGWFDKADVVDPAGATDTLLGFFAGYMFSNSPHSLKRWACQDAVELACKAARIAVSRPGSLASIPTEKEVLNSIHARQIAAQKE